MNKKLDTQYTFLYSEQAQIALEVAHAHHWYFRILGNAPIPTKPFYQGKWWYEPVTETPKGLDRLYALKKAGVKWQGLVIGHEVHFVEIKQPELPTPRQTFKNTDILPVVGAVAGAVAMGLIAMVGAIFKLMLIDPALVIVLEDNTWIEVVTWVE